jgi:DNA mismatch repair ATPase MutS
MTSVALKDAAPPSAITPAMQQYPAGKAEQQDCLLFYHPLDFYCQI